MTLSGQAGPHTIEFYLFDRHTNLDPFGQCESRVVHRVGVGNVFDRCQRHRRQNVEGHRFCLQHARIVRRKLAEAREFQKASL